MSSSISLVMHLLPFTVLGLLSCSAATDTLIPGRALTQNDKLVSANGKFALGFFPSGSKFTNNTYLGIWFNQVPELTPVWTAHRDSPISNQSTRELKISTNGNLIILAESTVIWSTKANITTNGTVAILLNNGNFVLRNSSNSSQTFWESFDYPTDIALSGAKLGWNKITGVDRRLVSRKNSVDQASGLYSSGMDSDGIGQQVWNSSVVYWSSGTWNGKFFSSEPEMAAGSSVVTYTYFKSDQEAYFIYTIMDDRIIMYNVLDVSGQRMMRTWTGKNWNSLNTVPKSKCEIYATCGPFTICADNGDTLCKCMKGFSIKSPEDWELEDTSGGCIRNTPLNCGGGNRNKTGIADKFYSMPGTRLPPNRKGIINASSADECAQVCLSNCSCTAYSYGTGGCSIWHDELLNVAMDNNNGQTLSLRLAAKEVQSSKSKKSIGKIIGSVVAASIASIGLIILLLILIRRKKKLSTQKVDNCQGGVGVISYKYVDLQRATKNFSEKLGAGSFGSVFKGRLTDSVAVAVKRLDGTRQGDKEFRAEVSSLGIIQHINLVKLIGFCCDGDRRLLVYEYMPNHSLDTHLFQSNSTYLDWEIRCQIALGVARGLAYLHHGCRDCIIHCDIKPQNILLDASFVPKIADFGMAKFLGREFSRVVTTMRGTIGYLAPEWISGTAVTSKVDVYSYGMVLLEIISGRRNWNVKISCDDDHAGSFPMQVAHNDDHKGDFSVYRTHNDDDYAGSFPVQVAYKLLHGDISGLADPRLNGNVNLAEVERFCKVACWCIQDNEFDRPTMNEVVQCLEGTSDPDMPPMPKLLHAIAGISHVHYNHDS